MKIHGKEIEGVEPQKAPLDARTLFVQFADGSKWGDPSVGDALLSQRTTVQDFLERLKGASGDSQAFLAILKEDQTPATSVWATREHLNLLLQQSDLKAVVNNVNERLAIAHQRQSFLK